MKTLSFSGLAAAPSGTSFPIFRDDHPPHTVDGKFRYTIGFATERTTGTIFAYGARVKYTIP